jgi:hypothetical protein
MLDFIKNLLKLLLGDRNKVYICGPMTGLPDLNFPAFYKAEDFLKKMGWKTVNPANNGQGKKPYEWYLRRDLKQMLECNSLVLLNGWENSNGARLEEYVASKLKMPIYSLSNVENGFNLTKNADK